MKYSRFYRFLSLGVILALLVSVLAVPAHAAGTIVLQPGEGRINDWIEASGSGFNVNAGVNLYFSSNEAEVNGALDFDVTAYQFLQMIPTDDFGNLVPSPVFVVPEELTQGSDKEDVHIGVYYVYATYVGKKTIVGVAEFTVIGSEIKLDTEEGVVGTVVRISGEEMRPNQGITVEYDGDEVGITSGDTETDSQGEFTSTIVIPESIFGSHAITVTDESGNNPEAAFIVRPQITLDPPNQVVGGVVTVNGTGFAKYEYVTVTLDSSFGVHPRIINANYLGSFTYSFTVPLINSWGVRKVRAIGEQSESQVEAQFNVLTSIALSPVTSPDSPGYVGQELSVRGVGFIANGAVTVTYAINSEVITVATATADDSGNLSVKFTVPASGAGSHVVTATDGTTSVNTIFTMESQAPPVPQLLLPEVASTSPAEVYFDWEDVIDPSGVSYILQVATDGNFATIVLEREGLSSSEYAVGEGELASAGAAASYCWRVKAVDGASNESDWSIPRLFYAASSGTSLVGWVWYTIGGFGVLLLVAAGFWWWRRRTR